MARISSKKLAEMFRMAGVKKETLYAALRQMGAKNVKPSLRHEWSPDNPTRNYCYVIAEYVLTYLAPMGSTSYKLDIPGDTAAHRFVRWPDGSLVDLAAEQFPDYSVVAYGAAKRCGFMAPSPSKRARMLAQLMGEKA